MACRARSSNCSSDLPVDVYWHASPSETRLSVHVEAITDALMSVVKAPPQRRWNPYLETMVRQEFRQRVMAASRGALKPIDHVKSITDPLAAEMFEIRWQHVQVTEVQDDGRPAHRPIQVRLLHAEPDHLGVVVLALHAHEKRVVVDDARATRAAQDAEIREAVGIYAQALPMWLARSSVGPLLRDLDQRIR